MSVNNIMNLSGKVEQFGGTVAAWIQLIIAIKTFYDFEYLLKMDGNGSCSMDVDQNLMCPGEPCCIDYEQSLKLPGDAVIIEGEYWKDCTDGGDLCELPTDESDMDYFVCKDVDGNQVFSVKSPYTGSYESMALSGNIAFQAAVWLAIAGYIISESVLMAVEWKLLPNPTEGMDFGSMIWTAFTNILMWFWIFPTVLITNSAPHSNCMHLSPIGGIDTGLMVKMTFGWLGVFGLCLGCIFVVLCSEKEEERKQAAQAGLMGLAFLVVVSTGLGLYTQILSVVDSIESVTFGVLVAQVISRIGLGQQYCFPLPTDL